MAMLPLKSAWPELSDFQKIVFISDFFVQIDPGAKFQPNWTKDKRPRISTSNDSEDGLLKFN